MVHKQLGFYGSKHSQSTYTEVYTTSILKLDKINKTVTKFFENVTHFFSENFLY